MTKIIAISRNTSILSLSCTTAGSTTLTLANTTVFNQVYIGMLVTGDGIPTLTRITAKSTDGSRQVTLSASATDSTTADRTFEEVAYQCPTNPKLKVIEAATIADNFTVISPNTLTTGTEPTFTALGVSSLNSSTVTSGSKTVTVSSTSSLFIGQSVQDTSFRFPKNTVIDRIASSTVFVTNNAATATSSGSALRLGQQLSNLETTSGFRLKCHDAVSETGFNFTQSQIDQVKNNTDNYYFVLVHSDNHLKHHFARIKEIHSEDSLGDSFDFEPKLGNEIEENVKFKLYSFPIPSFNHPHAISAGINSSLNDSLICSRPLFYFFDEYLDKKGQLNHNEKYGIKFNTGLETSTIVIDSHFTTMPDFGTGVIDNSKFSMKVQLVDRLKDQDDPLVHTSNEGVTNTAFNPFDRDSCFVNARRDSEGEDDESHGAVYTNARTGADYSGPKRYLHYDFSPTISNYTENAIDCSIEESVGAKGGYAELKIIDSSRMLTTKIPEFSPIRIRHQVHRAGLFDWVELPITITAIAAHPEYSTRTEFDISSFLNVGDEVRVDNRILIVKTIDAYSAFSQDITFEDFTRLETASAFTTTTYSLSIGDKIYRRAYNETDKTIVTEYPMIDDRDSVLYVVLGNSKLESLEATVTSSDASKKLLTLDFNKSSYSQNSSLRYALGIYSIEIERLNGEIESIESSIENGTNVMRLTANSQSRKLISNIVDKNTLFSRDMIYSSDSPYNKLTAVLDDSDNGVQAIVSFSAGSKLIELKTAADITNAATVTISAGTSLFGKYSNGMMAYIGRSRLALSSNTTVGLEDFPRAEGTMTLFKASTKHYVFNKALASNSLETAASNLNGVSNKGLYFDSGTTIAHSGLGTGATIDGQEVTTLAGTSISTNSEARGYYLSSATKLNSDSPFQARLDNQAHDSFSTFDTINTLMDFTIVDIKKGDFDTSILVAPYIPLTLGRVDINYANQLDTILSSSVLFNATAITSEQNFIVSSTNTGTVLGTLTSPREHYGKPIYVAGNFVGFFVGSSYASASEVTLYLDRNVNNIAAGAEVTTLDYNSTSHESSKQTYELNFLNGGHLHTGKTIGLLHPTIGAANSASSTVVPDNTLSLFDYPLSYSASLGKETYSNKFGSPYYRLISIEKGNFNLVNSSITGYTSSEEFNFYGEKLSKVKYYSTTYRFNPGFYIDGVKENNIIGTDITCADYQGSIGHSLIESRGYDSPIGSRFLNELRFSANTYPYTSPKYIPPNPTLYGDNVNGFERSPYIAQDVLDNKDPKISRMFLFSNCDLLPYSGSRIDSLFNSTVSRDLTKYGIMLIDEPIATDSSDTKTNVLGETKRITSNDSSHTFGAIKSSSKSVGSANTTFKNFSIMRLTEIVLDFAFNQFDPENPPSNNRVVPTFQYACHGVDSVIDGSTNQLYSRSIPSSNVIRCSGSPNGISANDLIVDSAGKFMGKVASVSTTDITCDEDIFKTINNAGTAEHYFAASGTGTPLYFIPISELTNADSGYGPIKGHGKQDTFINFDDDIHLLKSAIMTNTTSSMYGKSGSDFHTKYSSNVLGDAQITAREANLWLPIDIDSDSFAIKSNGAGQPSQVLEALRAANVRVQSSTNSHGASNQQMGDLLYTDFMPVIFDRFKIEEGTTANADIGMCCPRVLGMSLKTVEDQFAIYGLGLDGDYASKKDTGTARTNLSTDADGVIFGFKPLLKIHNTNNLMSSDKGPNNTTIVRITIPDTQAQFLSFVDLTGCYLAPENGKYIKNDGDDISLGTHSDGESLNGVTPDKLLYVLSHELDVTNATKTHILTVDDTLVAADTYYRILQPNHTCFYNSTPNDIRLNELSSRYTKRPNSDSMYDSPNSYFVEGGSGKRTLAGEAEAVLSMYVIADPNDVSTADHVVIRTPDKLTNIWNLGDDGLSKETMCIADGENFNVSAITFSKDSTSIGYYMSIGEQKEMIGIPSVSEIIELKVEGEISTNAKRAVIGTGVTICREADDLIEEMLEENNIDFNLTKNTEYPFFLAPNFRGVNLFQAINFIMSKKDKTLTEINGVLTIADKSAGLTNLKVSNYPDINISVDNKDIDLFAVEKLKTMYNFSNNVTVIGKNHRATKKNLKSVNKLGKKTLQEYDTRLVTQEEVNSRALELLKLHGDFNFKVRVEVSHKGLGQIRAGDIVSLELPRENIPFAEFLVLQITHTMRGMLILELGRYSKQLEDRFAEIQITQQQTLADNTGNIPDKIDLNFLDDINLKLIRFLAQKRSSSAGTTLGFSGPLNTGTYTLGFVGSGTTTTDLLEEEF
tara:strand:- start:1642 stop:8502 length:6861 start_codon:yes stop_codon:yes gene_type:complete